MQTWMYLAVPVLAYATERILIVYEHSDNVNIIKVLASNKLYVKFIRTF